MARFSTAKTRSTERALRFHPDRTINKAGGLAFNTSAENQLYLMATTSLLHDKVYVSATAEIARLRTLLGQVSRSFVLRLAAYSREQLHLRTFPMVLLVEAARMGEPVESKADVRAWTPRILTRADEPLEAIAYWLATRGTKAKMPRALLKGIADAMERWDEYHFAKYDSSKRSVRWSDAIRIVHPTPKTPERSALYGRIRRGDLATPETWETYISAQGSTAETWNHISQKMGIMALMRNLRNFEQAGAEQAIARALSVFSDAESVKRSKQLPFRWMSAAKQVGSPVLRDAMYGALEASVDNLPTLEGSTAVIVDLSGSMTGLLNRRSTVSYMDISVLLGAMANRMSTGQSTVVAFGHSAREVPLSRYDSVMTSADIIRKTDVGHATHAHLAVRALGKHRYDRVILLSDMQCYGVGSWMGQGETLAGVWTEYRKRVAPEATLYSMNLAANDGSVQFPDTDPSVVQLGGWSDKVLRLIAEMEKGDSVLDLVRGYT